MRRSYFLVYLLSSLLFFSATVVVSQYYFLEGIPFSLEASTVSTEKQEPPAPKAPEDVYQPHSDFLTPTHYVNFPYLNVRATPTIFSELIQVLQQNDHVVLFKKINHDWCQIEPQGYVACRYLSPL